MVEENKDQDIELNSEEKLGLIENGKDEIKDPKITEAKETAEGDEDAPKSHNVNKRPRRSTIVSDNVEIIYIPTAKQVKEAEWWAGFAPLIGTAWVFMSALFFTISNLIVQLCKNVDPLNLAVYRFFGIFLPLLPIIVYKRYNLFPKGCRIWLVLRCVLGASNLLIHFYGLKHMPLADVNMVAATSPIICVFLARLVLKEKFGFVEITNLLGIIIGIALIVQPPALVNLLGASVEDSKSSDPAYYMAAIFLILGTFMQATVYISLRNLKTMKLAAILFAFGLFGFLESLILVFIMSPTKSLYLPTFTKEDGSFNLEIVYLAAIGSVSLLAQVGLTMAARYESAGTVSLLRKAFDIVYSFLFQIFLFNIIPGTLSIIGTAFIAAVIVSSALTKYLLSLPETHSVWKIPGIKYFITPRF